MKIENKKINIGIIGASGVAGSNMLDLLLKKDYVNDIILFSTSLSGEAAKDHIENYGGELKFNNLDYDKINSDEYNLNFLILAVPHGKAKEISDKIKNNNIKIIDLSADHRTEWTYGLPELYKDKIINSNKIGNPGCYATACLLSIIPLIKKHGDNIEHIVFDCISGYSGGGKNTKEKYDADENIIAYNITNHFHLKEIKNEIYKISDSIKVSFTPHVVPVYSGIMCTTHITFKDKHTTNVKELKNHYKKFYKNTNTSIKDITPCSKDVINTGECHIGGFEIDDDNQLVIISVIDNLMKGAVSQAIENLELMK